MHWDKEDRNPELYEYFNGQENQGEFEEDPEDGEISDEGDPFDEI